METFYFQQLTNCARWERTQSYLAEIPDAQLVAFVSPADRLKSQQESGPRFRDLSCSA